MDYAVGIALLEGYACGGVGSLPSTAYGEAAAARRIPFLRSHVPSLDVSSIVAAAGGRVLVIVVRNIPRGRRVRPLPRSLASRR